MPKNSIKLATVFSGIGAIEQAFLQLNLPHEIVLACDNGERTLPENITFDKYSPAINPEVGKNIEAEYKKIGDNLVEKTYKANYSIDEGHFHQDIRFIDATCFQNNIDILVGGSPCQAFSSNGKRKGFSDIRGTLFHEYMRFIIESQPRCFIFENVRGMLAHDGKKTWQIVKKSLQSLNYNIHIHTDSSGNESPTLNAKDYGIPQNRERIFVIGFRKDVVLDNPFVFPQPVPLATTTKDYFLPKVDAKYYLGEKGFKFVTTHPSRAQVGSDIMNCQKANQQFNWNGDFIFEPLDKIGNPSAIGRAFVGEWNGQIGVTRKFTPRECLRLMGFPDSFKIVVNDTTMYRQCGNSIVVNVLVAILIQIVKTGVFDYD